MYGTAYHRRQAEILARIAKTVSNVDAAAVLSALAAKHRALADQREQPKRPVQKGRTALRRADREPGRVFACPLRWPVLTLGSPLASRNCWLGVW